MILSSLREGWGDSVRRWGRLEALAVDDGGTALVVLLLGDPHLLEGGKGGQNRTTDPDGVLAILSTSSTLSLNFCAYSAIHIQFFCKFIMANFGASAANYNPNKSAEVAQPPSDSVSSLSFSPKANLLVATSWDNQVRCWEIMRNGTTLGSVPKASMTHDQPVLCSTWKDDGTTVFSGGCDKQVKMWPLLSGGQAVTVAIHDAPIKEVAWIPEMNMLVSGSWDKTLRYWDLRQSTPVHTQQLPDRCYALSVRHPLMVVGTADRNIVVFNLQNPQTEFKRITSPLKYQTRCVAAFPDQQGFLVGSIEGRVGVHHLDDSQQSKNFTFKCHRDGNEIYSVNSLNFHPVHHTFATSGSDGAFNFWDKDSKQRLKAMTRCNQPIPCSTFNNDGSIFAYSVCYDWSKGAENHNPSTAKTYIFLHSPQEAEVKGKPRVATSGRK